MIQLELFPDLRIKDNERLYVIGNGFDIHHLIESKYVDFKKWVQNNKDTHLVSLMDTFFSNDCDFWADIENALGDYRENDITNFCEPDSSDDFKYDHPGQWQAGLEDSIPTILGEVMNDFRNAFIEWVKSISIGGIDDGILLPYQNAYSEVIEIMNQWTKVPIENINRYKCFFQSLHNCKVICIMGLSYNIIDMPYLMEISSFVNSDCKWCLYYFSKKDMENAQKTASFLRLRDYYLKVFE